MAAIQSRTRTQIRQTICRAIGGIVGLATGGADTVSLIDTKGLGQFGDDELNGRRVYMTLTAGATATDDTYISDFTGGGTADATLGVAVSGNVAANDVYELYPLNLKYTDIHDAIDMAIMEVTSKALQVKRTDGQMTTEGIYEYNWLSSFVGLHTVEYVRTLTEHELSDCDSVWTAGSSVTASLDAINAREGDYCAKLVVASGAAAGAVLGYINIDSVNIYDCDKVEFDMYSSITLTSGQQDFVLSSTVGATTTTETIDIPAMTAATWYRHSLTLANPESDTAIISIGIVNTTDVGAFTIYIDNVRAVKNGSKVWKVLSPDHWNISKGSTNYLKFTPSGLSIVGSPTQIRLTGYQIPSLLTADSSTSEIDPEFIIHYAIGYLLLYHSQSSQLDLDNKEKIGLTHMGLAENIKRQITVSPVSGTRMI